MDASRRWRQIDLRVDRNRTRQASLNDELGAIELERNEPLTAEEDGDTWIVTGSESDEFNAQHPPASGWTGPLQMRISQFDGQILSYVFTFDWGKAKATARPSGG